MSLDRIGVREFIQGWRAIVGEPPAAMLADRREMIALLVASVPAAEIAGPGADARAGTDPPDRR